MRFHLSRAAAVAGGLLAFSVATPPVWADVLYHQTFTNNADGDVSAALGGYGIAHHRGTKGRDRGTAKVVRHEASKPQVPAEDVHAAAPHRNDSQPDAGLVRIGLKPGDRVLMFVPLDGATLRSGGQHPGPIGVAGASGLSWQMVFGNSNSPRIQLAVRRGERWYVQARGTPVKGGNTALSVELLDEQAMWQPLAFASEQTLRPGDGEASAWADLDGPITALGYYAQNDGEQPQTIRVDNWRLTGQPGVAPPSSAVPSEPPVEPQAAPTFGPLPHETPVGPPGAYTTFGIYGESPESPDGSRLLYTMLDRDELSPFDDLARGSIWVADTDLENHRKLRDIEFPVRVHNGVFQQWVDHDSIGYSGGHHFAGDVYIVNADTGETEWGPYTGAMLGDNNFGGYVFISVWSPESNLGEAGLYELNTATGEIKQIVTTREIAEVYNERWDDGTDDPRGWFVAHPKFSTDGTHIAFTISTNNLFDRNYTRYGNTKGKQHLFTARRDGSDLREWGIDKPMHFDWYNERLLWGADIGIDDGFEETRLYEMRTWSRDKRVVETLAGPGCHVAKSPDGQWFAGETWYRSNPVVMKLYRRGELEPTAILFEHPFADITWTTHRAHVNPAFSRDSTKLYYKRAVSDELVQTFVVDLADVAGPAGATPGAEPR
ncbi:MAG: hypothetical protein AAFX76_01205 [Planctomycetota bacterium]